MDLNEKYKLALEALRFYALGRHTYTVFDTRADADISYVHDRGEIARQTLDELVEPYAVEDKGYVGPY